MTLEELQTAYNLAADLRDIDGDIELAYRLSEARFQFTTIADTDKIAIWITGAELIGTLLARRWSIITKLTNLGVNVPPTSVKARPSDSNEATSNG